MLPIGMAGNGYNFSFQGTHTRTYLVQSTLLMALMVGIPSAFPFQHISKVDSLQALLQTASDTTEVNLLNELAKQYWRIQANSAQQYALEALNTAQQIRYQKGEAEAYRILGWSFNNQGNQDQASLYLKRAIRIFEQIRYDPGLAAALNNLGVVSYYSGNYEEGLHAHRRALTIFRRLDNQEAIGSVLNYIGINYQSQGNYEKAI